MEEGSRVLFAAISWRVIGGKLVGMRWMEGRCLRASRRRDLGFHLSTRLETMT